MQEHHSALIINCIKLFPARAQTHTLSPRDAESSHVCSMVSRYFSHTVCVSGQAKIVRPNVIEIYHL